MLERYNRLYRLKMDTSISNVVLAENSHSRVLPIFMAQKLIYLGHLCRIDVIFSKQL